MDSSRVVRTLSTVGTEVNDITAQQNRHGRYGLLSSISS